VKIYKEKEGMNIKNKIGFIGLGNMGIPMVKNLLKAGYEVTVFNRNFDKAQALAKEVNVKAAEKIQDLITADVIISMLSDDAAVSEVYSGAEGILKANPSKDLIILDMSTVSPETSRRLADEAKQLGIAYLDAPVSGSVKPATDGQLVIMVGGETTAFEQVKPILLSMGKSATLLGGNGAGNLGVTIQGLSEAVVFASNHGITADALLPLINESAVGSGITKVKTENIIQRNFAPAFALKLLRKDIRLAQAMGLSSGAGTTLAKTLAAAVESGYGDEDMIAILKQVEQGRN